MPFDYALLRAVPRIERGEQINVAVMVYCQAHDYLSVAVHLDLERLRALDPQADVEAILAGLDAVSAICAGSPAGGRPGGLTAVQRFGWLTSPRSTMIQPGPVHCGLTASPQEELARLELALLR